MSVTVLEKLEREDLSRFRTLASTLDLIQARPPTLTLTEEEIRRAYLDYYALFAELMEDYGISAEEALEAKISSVTGHIYVGREE